jgi:hypothetical protein
MLLLTFQYIPFNSQVAFLRIKQTEVNSIKPYLPVFYVHVYSSIFVLLAGFTQFSSTILKEYKPIHRFFGYIYVIIVLCLAAPSGVFMGIFANGVWHTKASFMILGSLWFWFTLKAFIAVKNKKFKLHQNFMLRSFALATSAITLRMWKVMIVYTFHTAPMDTYKIIAWLGWIPNLIIAEYLINKKHNK